MSLMIDNTKMDVSTFNETPENPTNGADPFQVDHQDVAVVPNSTSSEDFTFEELLSKLRQIVCPRPTWSDTDDNSDVDDSTSYHSIDNQWGDNGDGGDSEVYESDMNLVQKEQAILPFETMKNEFEILASAPTQEPNHSSHDQEAPASDSHTACLEA
ncbi:hypothetical protein QJS10_CPB14g00306 [Acorus calamus]|uniref:Uncharacterized protein n=1 Tax=Acorus calamus TaxID=4465 RepID=A0AAV9DDF7_ACOCL|nr:hypothetical protein QJS10_CPB14g00306 [Acorus calamus]